MRTQVSACLSQITSKLLLWAGGHERLLNTKGHLLKVSHYGDIVGYLCDLFLAHYAFEVYLVYPSTHTCISLHASYIMILLRIMFKLYCMILGK